MLGVLAGQLDSLLLTSQLADEIKLFLRETSVLAAHVLQLIDPNAAIFIMGHYAIGQGNLLAGRSLLSRSIDEIVARKQSMRMETRKTLLFLVYRNAAT